MSPAEFEQQCAHALEAIGWRARAAGRTGDQGADVIADKAGHRLVLQCKLYTGSVGNAAVQQAHAAGVHFAARHACVVTHAAYTPSAIALARTTGVHLLHPRDLAGIDKRLGVPSRVPRVCSGCRVTMMIPHSRFGFVRCPRCNRRRLHWT